MGILRLSSINQEKIWGEEDWIISAHEHGESRVLNQRDVKLSEYYKQNKEQFGVEDEVFPLLVKIITANDDLSIQVHPNDEYALEKENSLGKTEAWLVLDAGENSDIIVGLEATDATRLEQAIEQGEFEDILNILPITQGDFFFIPAGTVHAIRSNTKILEIQQSSDVTYRLYDYGRLGDDGNPRDLHIQESLDVINYDYRTKDTREVLLESETLKITSLVTSGFFYIHKYDLNGEIKLPQLEKFQLLIALDDIMVNGEEVKAEEGIIILKETQVEVSGKGTFVIAGV